MTIEKKQGTRKYVYLGALILILFRLGVYLYKHPLYGSNDKKNADQPAYVVGSLDPIPKNTPVANGDAPLEGCFGKGDRDGQASLTIINDAALDIVVCLTDKKQQRTVRNVFVQQKSTYVTPHLKTGQYKVDVLLGLDWDQRAKNDCGGMGAFSVEQKFQHPENPLIIEKNGGILKINHPAQ
jgi:hypothetical protein